MRCPPASHPQRCFPDRCSRSLPRRVGGKRWNRRGTEILSSRGVQSGRRRGHHRVPRDLAGDARRPPGAGRPARLPARSAARSRCPDLHIRGGLAAEGHSTATVGDRAVTVASGLIAPTRVRRLAAADIAEVITKIGMQAGSTPYYDVVLVSRDGKKVTALFEHPRQARGGVARVHTHARRRAPHSAAGAATSAEPAQHRPAGPDGWGRARAAWAWGRARSQRPVLSQAAPGACESGSSPGRPWKPAPFARSWRCRQLHRRGLGHALGPTRSSAGDGHDHTPAAGNGVSVSSAMGRAVEASAPMMVQAKNVGMGRSSTASNEPITARAMSVATIVNRSDREAGRPHGGPGPRRRAPSPLPPAQAAGGRGSRAPRRSPSSRCWATDW